MKAVLYIVLFVLAVAVIVGAYMYGGTQEPSFLLAAFFAYICAAGVAEWSDLKI